MLLIYVPYKTQRIEYIWDFIFNEATKVNYNLTTSEEEFNKYDGPKLEYSNRKTQNTIWLWASDLLTKNILTNNFQEKKIEDWGYVLFPAENALSFIPFDLPSAVFWIISRYEEYISNNLDEHSRYDYRYSWLYRRSLINKPIVNIWIHEFIKKIKSYFPNLKVEFPEYNFISTIDVDNMYACFGKPFFLNFVGGIKSLLYGRFNLAFNRFTYYFKKTDLYDNYAEILKINNYYGVKPIFFILTSKRTKYDRNLLPENTFFKKTIDFLRNNSEIGIHFSYYSFEKQLYNWELKTLENITKAKIFKNRFHYLKYRLPNDYEKLIDYGILEDYSMMYAQKEGFRAGTCTPFYFFNLKTNQKTNLKIYSSPFMDRHLIKNKKLLNNEIFNYIQDIKKFNGTFVLLWHNETLLEKTYYNSNLKDLYKMIIEYAVK